MVEGDILVDGRALGASFQRTTAYVSQMDIHDPHATVREALIFSALLRQPRDVPEEEKLAYVETVIDMLDVRSAFFPCVSPLLLANLYTSLSAWRHCGCSDRFSWCRPRC